MSKDKNSPIVTSYPNGQKCVEEYWVDGQLHREPLEGPAYTFWYSNGQKYYEIYWVNGERHRDPTLGPAEQ